MTREKVAASGISTSVAFNEPIIVFNGAFSEIVLADKEMLIGASLTFVTPTRNDFSIKSPPTSVVRRHIL